MATESDPDTSRAVVQTYVPAYQREKWDDHAEELGMSRSEFVRTMVQAGRRHFGEQPAIEETESTSTATDEDELETQVLELLEASEACTWDDLLAGVTGDIETRLEDTLQELQESDRIRYSGREGGYILK